MRIDVHEGINLVPARPSASTTAQNISGAVNHRVPNNAISGNSNQGPLSIGSSEYGLEVEIHNMLVLDQNTFEGKFLIYNIKIKMHTYVFIVMIVLNEKKNYSIACTSIKFQ